jgi:hypothetical protein
MPATRKITGQLGAGVRVRKSCDEGTIAPGDIRLPSAAERPSP